MTDRRTRRLIIWAAAGVAFLLVLVASLVYTEQSYFCPTCHEMDPYYQAWTTGPHAKSAQCVDCHVDSGVLAHLAHKPIALKEVWDHFFANSRFPNYTVDLPNSRCVRCHPSVPDKQGSVFSHALHATKTTCKACHTQTGHLVSLASLEAAGVLKQGSVAPVPGDMTPSSITGHKVVVCQECHDQASMKCSSCHQPPHDHYGTDCAACHTPGTPFAQATFAHPDTEHNIRRIACVKCHPSGLTTTYCSCHDGNPPSDD